MDGGSVALNIIAKTSSSLRQSLSLQLSVDQGPTCRDRFKVAIPRRSARWEIPPQFVPYESGHPSRRGIAYEPIPSLLFLLEVVQLETPIDASPSSPVAPLTACSRRMAMKSLFCITDTHLVVSVCDEMVTTWTVTWTIHWFKDTLFCFVLSCEMQASGSQCMMIPCSPPSRYLQYSQHTLITHVSQ